MLTKQKAALIILDGWGHGQLNEGNAIYKAKTPFIDSLYKRVPNSKLLTHGENVGLPHNQMGNSEVGHLNIGAGRVVLQELEKINHSINNNSFQKNKRLLKAILYAKKNNKPIHLMGLLSNGGIHSHQKHLEHLCKVISDNGVNKIFIHVFTDGRDTDPKSGLNFMKKFISNTKDFNVHVVSIIGRYYSMDRDKRWERTQVAYNLLTKGEGEVFSCPLKAIESSYKKNITDEFITPKIISKNNSYRVIKEDDAVICFNFRTDRCRQITEVLTQKKHNYLGMFNLRLHYTTMTNYDNSFNDINVLFQKEIVKNSLGEVISNNGLTQLRIAETEKYPHVTYFFSGGNEEAFINESRLLIESPKVATYDLKPEMNAFKVKKSAINLINKNHPNFICLNFANADMVGHTGNFNAAKKAIETTDYCAKEIAQFCINQKYNILIIADHGNAEYMINTDGSPNTAHTTNDVPCFLLNSKYSKIKNGILADIAPTIIKILGLVAPPEMTGKSLV